MGKKRRQKKIHKRKVVRLQAHHDMTSSVNLKTMQQELREALDLINQKNATSEVGALVDPEGLSNTQSLLERCAEVVKQSEENTKPTLRIIHHFACSGGSLICKCLAAQPNVFLLSELHPTTRHGNDWSKADYTPRDVITQAFYGGIPNAEELAEKIFVDNIIKTEKHVRDLGGTLLIRAHSHADYCMSVPQPEVDTVTRLLEPYFNIKQLVTVRNPVDSFLSLRENHWVHFQPNTFEEYCRRLLQFLKPFKASKIAFYEHFVAEPEQQIKYCAETLDLPVLDHATDYIDVLKVSGDSGRSGSEITPRSRKPISDEYKQEILQSESFKTLCEQYEIQPLTE